MMKTISKFVFFVFLGLILFVPKVSYAQKAFSSTSNNTSSDAVMMDAWSFMKENSSEYSRFQKEFGEGYSERSMRMQCGPATCNIDTQICMVKSERLSRKERRKAKDRTDLGTDLGGTGQALSRQGRLFGEGRHLLTYACVLNKDVSSYQKSGYDIYDTDSNVEDKRKRDRKTDTCFTAKGENAGKYCVRIIGNTVEVRSVTGRGDGCQVIPVAWYNNRKCVFCSLMGGVFAAADHIAIVSQEVLSYSFAIVIALGLLIWIAMKTVSFVSSMTKQDAAKYITELIKQSYKFVIVFVILSNYGAAFDIIVRPLLRAGLSFGQSFVSVQNIKDRYAMYYDESDPADVSILVKNKNDDDFPIDYAKNIDNQFFDFGTYVAMENFAYNVNLNYSFLQTVGSSLFCLGWRYAMGRTGEGLEFGLGFACMIYGGMLSSFGFLLCMAFIFYLLDAVVQLGIVGGLLPFLIASWPFKITSKYTSTGFKMFLNSVFTFMMMGFVVKVTILLIDNAIGGSSNEADKMASGLMMLATAVDNVQTDTLRKMVDVLSVGFCVLVFASIMGFLLLSKVAELTSKFASGGMKGSASSLATMAASTLKGAAGKLMAPTSKALGKKAEDLTAGAAKFAGNVLTAKHLRGAIAKRSRAARIKGSRPSNATLGSSK